jgi:hypothetical protein
MKQKIFSHELTRIIAKIFLCVICGICGSIQAASEINAFAPGVTTAYAVVRQADGGVWYPTGQVFETWGTSGRTAADYDIALTDKGGDMFVGTFDPNIAAQYCHIVTHYQAGGSPADSDPVVWQEYGYWSGTVWTPGTVADFPTKEEIRAEIDANSTQLATIVADTNELQTDWTNGGRLDLLINAILEDTGTTLPNQITALVIPDPAGTAAALHIITDALINGENDLSSAEVEAAMTAALIDYDPPTKDEMDVAIASVSVTVDNAAIADAVHDEVVEGTVTLRQALRLFLSVMTGKSSGGGTTSITFRDIGDTKNRLNVTVDSKGNRTAVNTRDGN